MAKKVRENIGGVPLNFVFALASGDIVYQAMVRYPVREYGVIQGAYPKKGHLPENSWKGFVPLDELPYVVNPRQGYISSANNLITSSNVKHGISHSFTFAHRGTRIGELLEAAKANGRKVTGQDMIDMQLDVLDIQARDSMKDFLKLAEQGRHALDSADTGRARLAIRLLEQWDFQMDGDTVAGVVFLAWEHQLGRYLHEGLIQGERARRGLKDAFMNEMWVARQAQQLAREKRGDRKRAWCKGYEQLKSGDCAELWAFALARAVEDLEKRGGKDPKKWALNKITRHLTVHAPFSKVGGPLALLYTVFEPVQAGNRRTVNMSWFQQHHNLLTYLESAGGSILRFWSDSVGTNDHVAVSMDLGVESHITSRFRRAMKDEVWDKNDYLYLYRDSLANGNFTKTGDTITFHPGIPTQ